MTIEFVQRAMTVDEDEAHDFRLDVQRNGKGVFACNVLMYHSDKWEGKMTNSELYTRDGPITDPGLIAQLDPEEQRENAFMQALQQNAPKERALQWCRYLMCKHANVRAKPLKQNYGNGGQ